MKNNARCKNSRVVVIIGTSQTLLGVIQSSLSFMLYDKKVIEYQDFSLKQIQVHTVHMHEPILHLYPDY